MSSHESDKPPPTLYSISIGLLAGGVAGGVYVLAARLIDLIAGDHEGAQIKHTPGNLQVAYSCGTNRTLEDPHASARERESVSELMAGVPAMVSLQSVATRTPQAPRIVVQLAKLKYALRGNHFIWKAGAHSMFALAPVPCVRLIQAAVAAAGLAHAYRHECSACLWETNHSASEEHSFRTLSRFPSCFSIAASIDLPHSCSRARAGIRPHDAQRRAQGVV
jgi:hypothetical protein